jgi:putative membrane protein
MLKRFLVQWLIVAVAIAIAAAILPSVHVHGGFGTLLWVALLFGLVNAILGPILHLLALPITALTLGLFALVVNGALLAITAGLSDNLDVGGFFGTIVGALLISILTAILGLVARPLTKTQADA